MWITLDTERIYGSKRSAVAWSLASHHFLPGLNSSDTICGLSLLLALTLLHRVFPSHIQFFSLLISYLFKNFT